jgi:adenylate cyclase
MTKKLSFKILGLLIIFLFAFCIYKTKPSLIHKIALNVQDMKFIARKNTKYQPKPIDNILIVAVDEKSVNQLGRWPWDRKVIGDLFKKLNMASIVGLDIVFSEKTNEQSDNYLAEVIEDNDNIILGFFFRNDSTQKTTTEIEDRLSDYALNRIEFLSKKIGLREFKFAETNIPVISESALSGAFFSTEPDIDGLYRNYPLAFMYNGNIYPSLAVQLVRFYLNKDLYLKLDDKGIKEFSIDNITIKNSNRIKLNFYDDIKYISAIDILSGAIKPDFFKNKIVIVGVTEIGVFDLRPTPIDTITPGVSLHLTAVSNILKKEFLTSSVFADVLLMILAVLFPFFLSFIENLFIRISGYLIGLILFISISYLTFFYKNLWLNEFYFATALILSSVFIEILAFLNTEAKSREIKKAFSAYVSPEVVNIMTKDPDKLKLGGEEREISVMFADIRGFTTLSEKLNSEEIVYILNRLNDPLTEVILKNEGLLDKYIGDAIMALFNTPIDIENHADKCCLSALEMVKKLHVVNEQFKAENLPEVDIGIGINSGNATVGNMGSKIRFDYTAIGDTVNLASRLEGLNKTYKSRIIISEFTLEKLKGDFLSRQLDKVRVKGKHIPIKIFELLENTETNQNLKKDYEEALKMYFDKEFKIALKKFEDIYKTYDDKTSEIFIKRCNTYIEAPPENKWDGVFTFKTK